MDISVIICTCDRATSLDRVLASAAEMNVPDVEWELLVVHTGNSNDVEKILESYQGRLPLRLEREPQRGLSRARNLGVKKARGNYIVWTDDDVIVDKNWLLAYAHAIRRRPDAVLFGGKIVPVLEPPRATWFEQNMELLPELLAVRDFGSIELPLSVHGLPYGANYAVRAVEQRAFLYDINLGAGSGTAGEETRVIQSLLESGFKGYWLPDAIVYHLIPSERQTTKYVLERYKAQGATTVYLSREDQNRQLPVTVLAANVAVRYIMYLSVRLLNLERLWIKRLKGYAHWRGALEERLRKR
jgi:glycosyltransferase involved in cell wall biosynthesis